MIGRTSRLRRCDAGKAEGQQIDDSDFFTYGATRPTAVIGRHQKQMHKEVELLRRCNQHRRTAGSRLQTVEQRVQGGFDGRGAYLLGQE